ncbi:MAG: HDOD domain-containing protein [Archangium sp.]
MDLEALIAARIKQGAVRAPPSPLVALRLMQLLADERTPLAALKSTLEKDQTIAAIVLRLANSARYRWGREVSSLQQAIVVLGRKALREVGIAKEMHERTMNGSMLSLRRRAWRESLASAHVASVVAGFFKVVADEAFVAGLLHDLGRAPAIGVLEEVLKSQGASVGEAEAWAVVERHHVDIGSMIARTWGLPNSLVEVITRHHDAQFTSPMLEAVRLADQLVKMMDEVPCVTAESLAVFENLTADQRAELAKQLPLIPPTLDAFREVEPGKNENYELNVLDEAAVAQRVLHVTYEGLVTECKLQQGSAVAMTVSIPLQTERVVRVNAGDAAFYARVTASVGDTAELKLWGLESAQLSKWKAFVETGLEDLYSHAAA